VSANDQVARGKGLEVSSDSHFRDAKLSGQLGDRDPSTITDLFDYLLAPFFKV
jgi:hypothetical protein